METGCRQQISQSFFLTHILFVDNKTAHKLDGTALIVGLGRVCNRTEVVRASISLSLTTSIHEQERTPQQPPSSSCATNNVRHCER